MELQGRNISELKIHDLDTSNINKKYLACFRDKNYEITSSVVELIEIIKKSDTVEEVARTLSVKKNKEFTVEDITFLIDTCIFPLLDEKESNGGKTFFFKKELISEKLVNKYSGVFKFLFKPIISISLIIFVAFLHIMFYSNFFNGFYLKDITVLLIVGILFFFVFSSIVHELGHATASKYYGVESGGVGFGLYLHFPVFYTNVSNIWRLDRKKRIVINFAGTYFQLFILLPLFVLYYFTNSDYFKYFIFITNINFLFTLNPFFKFDGYWIMSDILGVPNLRKRSFEYYKYLFSKLTRKKNKPKPFVNTMRKKEQIFMIIYTVIVNMFFIFYFFYFLPNFIGSFAKTFPSQFSSIFSYVLSGKMPPVGLLRTFFGQLLMIVLIIYMLYNMIKPFISAIQKKNNK